MCTVISSTVTDVPIDMQNDTISDRALEPPMTKLATQTDNDGVTTDAGDPRHDHPDLVVTDDHDDQDRMGSVIAGSRKACGYVRDRVVAGARATDRGMHRYPYLGVAAGFSAGGLIGFFAARLFSRGDK